jgi:hypothetical protein
LGLLAFQAAPHFFGSLSLASCVIFRFLRFLGSFSSFSSLAPLIARSVSDKPGPEARSPGSQESTFKVRVSKREAAGGKSDSETEAGVGQSRSRVEEKEQGDSETKKKPKVARRCEK